MKRNNKIIYATIVILILGVGAAELGLFSKKETQVNEPAITPAVSKELFTLRVPQSSSSANSYDIANKLGYLEEDGIKLEYTGQIVGGPEALMALVSGANDASNSGPAHSALINAIAGGYKMKVIFSASGSNRIKNSKYVVLNDSGIFTAKDLRGKKLGVNTLGAASDYTIQEYLAQNNMTKDDVQIIVIGQQGTREQAFRQRQVDLINGDKRLLTFKEGGGVRVLFTDYEVNGRDISGGGLSMSEKFIKEHPDIVRKFVTANVRAIDWSAANPDEARELYRKIITENGGKPENADFWEGFGAPEHGLISKQDVQYWIDRLISAGSLKPGQIVPDDVYTNEFNPYYKR